MSSALIMWRSLMLFTGSESPVSARGLHGGACVDTARAQQTRAAPPAASRCCRPSRPSNSRLQIVVVLSGSMEPAFHRGDILFLNLGTAPIRTGEVGTHAAMRTGRAAATWLPAVPAATGVGQGRLLPACCRCPLSAACPWPSLLYSSTAHPPPPFSLPPPPPLSLPRHSDCGVQHQWPRHPHRSPSDQGAPAAQQRPRGCAHKGAGGWARGTPGPRGGGRWLAGWGHPAGVRK